MKDLFSLVRSFHVILLLCFLSAGICAADPAPRKYCNGVYINHINDFDMKQGTAEVDFWYWVVSDDSKMTLENLELSNGKMQPAGDVISQKKGGKFYLSRRYTAQVQCSLDLSKFPFDQQRIVLSFEDGDLTDDLMIFTPDTVNSGIDPSCRMNDWDIKSIEYAIGIHHYPSSFGDLNLPSGEGSNYSQFNVIVALDRRGNFWQKLFKYFWAIAVSVIVGLFSLLIRVCDLDARFGMAVGALFANVGCSFLISEKLPESPSISVAEWVSYISLGFIMIFLIESILSLSIYNSKHPKFSRWLDFGTFIVSIAGYGGIWFFVCP